MNEIQALLRLFATPQQDMAELLRVDEEVARQVSTDATDQELVELGLDPGQVAKVRAVEELAQALAQDTGPGLEAQDEPEQRVIDALVTISGAGRDVVAQVMADHGAWLTSIDELMLVRRYGFTADQARAMAAGIRLALAYKGVSQAPFEPGQSPLLNSGRSTKDYVMSHMPPRDREVFGAIYMNNKMRPISIEQISEGSINASIVHPREVMRRIVDLRASYVIFFHNHPGGDPTPSAQDDEVTNRLYPILHNFGVNLIDHVIVTTNGDYYSYADTGRLIRIQK